MSVKVEVNEKVTYRGREYAKGEWPAEKGDLLRCTAEKIDITVGNFYEVTGTDSDGYAEFDDDVGDYRQIGMPQYFDVYKPVGNVEYREVKRRARIGERIKVVSAWVTGGKYENGDILTVKDDDVYGLGRGVRVENDAALIHEEYVVLETVNSAKFERGDKVRLLSGGGEYPLIGFKDGEIYEVKDPEFTDHNKANPTIVELVGYGYARADQLEKAEDDFKAQERLKVGEYVKVVKADGRPEVKLGEIRKLTMDDKTGIPYEAETLDGKHSNWFVADELASAADAEVEAAKAELVRPKVGDYVRFVSEFYEHTPGKIARIREIDGSCSENWLRYGLDDLRGNRSGWTKRSVIEVISEDEANEAEKWAAIGRKPGEFKAGDIVEVLRDTCGHPVGTIGEVVYCPAFSKLRVKALGEIYSHLDGGVNSAKLVCPVEQRFDRGGGDAS